MVTRAELVAEARSWIGTRYEKNQSMRGVATDCSGLIKGVPQARGLYPGVAIEPYIQPDEAKMRATLEQHLDRVPFKELQPADVIWFRSEQERRHLGIVVSVDPLFFVHAWNRKDISRVVETRLDDFWRQRIAGCFRYRGVD